MPWRLLALLLALEQAGASWTAALMLSNGTTLTARDATLFRSDNPVSVYGVDGVVDLAFDETLMLAVTPTCVLSIHGSLSSVFAGSIFESGQRDGPPLYARFANLLAVAFVSPHSVALIDNSRADANIVWVNEWGVAPLTLLPHAFALSGSQSELLVVTPTKAHTLTGTQPLLSVSGDWVAGLLLSPGRALLASRDGDIWQWDIHGLQIQPRSQATASKLMLVAGVAWGVSFSMQAFFVVARPELVFVVIDEQTTRPADGACPSGYVLLWAMICVQASPGGYAVDGVFIECPEGTHNDQPQASTSASCKPRPPFTRASPAACVHCGLLPSNGIACVAGCPASIEGICDEADTLCEEHSDIIVATVARPAASVIAVAKNGTVYAARGSQLSILFANTHTTISESDRIGCMAITPDETTLYLGGDVLRRATFCDGVRQIITMSSTTPSDALCASNDALYVLYQGVVTLFAGPALEMVNVLHIVWDGALVALLRSSVTEWLQIVRNGVLQREFEAPEGFRPWIARFSGGTVMVIGNAVALWPDGQDMQWLAGSQQLAGSADDIADKARFDTMLGGQAMLWNDQAVLLLWNDQAVRVLFRGGCECPADHRRTPEGCAACSALTYAMPGATLCTACPRGSYMDGYGACQPCPAWWWGDAPTPCARLRDTLPRDPHLTFAEISAADTSVDFTLSVFVIGQPPQRNALPATDYLGRLWTSAVIRPSQPHCVPGIWALCAHPTGDDCECWYSIPLTLKPPWLEQNRLYARRGDTLLLLAPDRHMVVLPASPSLLCYIGWPYECACGDPTLYWSFANKGCVQCPPSTAVPPNATECVAISLTNPLCYEGQYLTAAGCRKCQSIAYSSIKNALACTPKRVLACEPGEYLVTSTISDNSCAACVPCIEGEITFGDACSGLLTHPSYVCTPWAQNIPGFSVIISEWPTLSFVPCASPLPAHSQWASGPQFGLCYFSCMYSVGDTQEYALDTGTLPWPDTTNLFPLAPSDSEICLPCDTTPCPVHTWRPLWTGECGAPCLLVAARLCPNNSSGCVSLCTIPANSHYTAPENCEWACDTGWFSRNGGCHVCQASSCDLDELYDAYACLSAEGTSCTPCPQPALVAVIPGVCRLDCPAGLFQQAFGGVCLPCSKGHYCPAGFRSVCEALPCASCSPDLLPANAIWAPSNDDTCRVNCKAGFQTIALATNDIAAYEDAYNATTVQCDECGLRSDTLFCPLLSCPVNEAIVTVATAEGSSLRCMPCQSSLRAGCLAGTYAMSPCPGGVATQSHCLICPALAEHQLYIPYLSSAVAACPFACINNFVPTAGGCMACSILYATTPTFLSYFARWDAPPAARWWPEAIDPPHLGLRLPNNAPEARAGKCWPCGSMGDPLCPPPKNSVSVPVLPDDGVILILARHLLSTPGCPPGSYALKQGGCALCPPKRFCLGGLLKRCPRFAISEAGASACTCRPLFMWVNGSCALKMQGESVAAQALKCSAGEYRHILPSGAPACFSCPKGTCPPLCTALPPFSASCDGGCLFGISAAGQCLAPQCPWLPSEKRCACGPGSQPQAAACLPCPKGTFSAHIGDAPCTRCPPNTTALAGATRLADCFFKP